MNGYSSSASSKPRLEIVEQPAPKALRFRYECEGRSAGSIPGEHSTPDNRTYPTVRVVGYEGNEDIVIVVSCVTKNQPYLAHPHNLVGKDCKEGVCSINLDKDSKTAVFSNLGIQCVKKRDIEAALKLRENKHVDPYGNGFEHKNNPSSIDLNCVRLCFQAIVKTPKPSLLGRVVSNPVYDKKAMSDLLITKLSHTSGPVRGGTEMVLLCEKINKDDIQVRFYEEIQGHETWEGFAKKLSVHKQVAIAFETPAYHNQEIQEKALVYVQLYRPSDKAASEPREFHYIGSGYPIGLKRQHETGKTFKRARNEEDFPSNSGFRTNVLEKPMPSPSPPLMDPEFLDYLKSLQSSPPPEPGVSSSPLRIAGALVAGIYDIKPSTSPFPVKIEPNSSPSSPYQNPGYSPSVTPVPPNDQPQTAYISIPGGATLSIPFDRTWQQQPSTSPSSSYQNQNAFLNVAPGQCDPTIPVAGPSTSPAGLGGTWQQATSSPSSPYQNPNPYLQSVKPVQTEPAPTVTTLVTGTLSSTATYGETWQHQPITQTEYTNTTTFTGGTFISPGHQKLFNTIQEMGDNFLANYTNATPGTSEPLTPYGNTATTNPINTEETQANVEMTSVEQIVETSDLVGTSIANANNAAAAAAAATSAQNDAERLCDSFSNTMNISDSFTRLVNETYD